MPQPNNHVDRQARAWLEQFSQALDADADLLESLPDVKIQAELQELGADVGGFHRKLRAALRTAKLQQVGRSLIRWFSPLWQPQWAGQFVGAGDIPEQHHTFRLDAGTIEISCSWKPGSGTMHAYLDLAWKADTLMEGELWCRFIDPDTNNIFADLPLGSAKEGGKYFTADMLKFDPSEEKWGLVILVK